MSFGQDAQRTNFGYGGTTAATQQKEYATNKVKNYKQNQQQTARQEQERTSICKQGRQAQRYQAMEQQNLLLLPSKSQMQPLAHPLS